MRGIDKLFALFGVLTVLRFYSTRNLLLLSAFGVGYAMTNMVLHPNFLHPDWEKEVTQLKLHKRYKEALNKVNQQIKIEPDYYLPYKVRAGVFGAMGNQQAAHKDYELSSQKLDAQAKQFHQMQARCKSIQANTVKNQNVYTQSNNTYTCRLLNPSSLSK